MRRPVEINQSPFEQHPTYREFERNGITVCEVLVDWSSKIDKEQGVTVQKLIWARNKFNQMMIEGFLNPMVHKDIACLASVPSEEVNMMVEMARFQTAEAFDKYWESPSPFESGLVDA